MLLRRMGYVFLASACLGAFGVACEFPFPSSKYQVEEGGLGGLGGAASEESIRVATAFAEDDAACLRAFASKCELPIERCAESSSCIQFAECVRTRAAPTAETSCADELGTSLADHWLFEFTRHCWAERHRECGLGRDFSCADGYELPTSVRSVVEVSQQVFAINQAADAVFSVSFCPGIEDCSEVAAQATTNPGTGIYELTLPIAGMNFGVGNVWEGYRIVEGSNIYPSTVATNVPVWGRRVEITRLLNRGTIDALSTAYERDGTSSLFVQVVDCQSDPAPGVKFDIPTSESDVIVYVRNSLTPVGPATVETGAAGIYGHEVDQLHEIRALVDGRVVAAWRGHLVRGRPMYLRLHPSGGM